MYLSKYIGHFYFWTFLLLDIFILGYYYFWTFLFLDNFILGQFSFLDIVMIWTLAAPPVGTSGHSAPIRFQAERP